MLDLEKITYSFTLTDGSEVDEPAVHAHGGFHAFCSSRDDLAFLTVCDDEMWYVRIALRPGLRPIFGRLWVHRLALDGGDGVQEEGVRWLRALCAGWQQTIETRAGPRNVKTLYWLTRDGIYLSDRDLDAIAET